MTKTILKAILVLDILVIVAIAVYIVRDFGGASQEPFFTSEPVFIPEPKQKSQKKEAPEKTAEKKPVKKRKPAAASKKETSRRKIMFTYRNSRPRQVSVLGEFNDWNIVQMKKGKNHTWSAVVHIKPGEYLYCYDVDGRLIPDPNNPNLRVLPGNEKRSLLTVKQIPK